MSAQKRFFEAADSVHDSVVVIAVLVVQRDRTRFAGTSASFGKIIAQYAH